MAWAERFRSCVAGAASNVSKPRATPRCGSSQELLRKAAVFQPRAASRAGSDGRSSRSGCAHFSDGSLPGGGAMRPPAPCTEGRVPVRIEPNEGRVHDELARARR